DHTCHEHRTIGSFSVAIDVTVLARHLRRHIDHARCERTIDIAAELRTYREPKFVVMRVSAIGRFDAALEIQPRLFARAPRTAMILEPLPTELFHGHVNAVPLKRTNGTHLIVPIVVHWCVAVRLWKIREPKRRSDLMLVRPGQQHGRNLRGPHSLYAIQ